MKETQRKFSSKFQVPSSELGKPRSKAGTRNLESGTFNLERFCPPPSALCAVLLALFLSFAPAPSTAEVTDAQVKEVAGELACLCGSCPHRPLDECSCGWADKNRRRIADALEAGDDEQTIVAAFVKEFGLEALSTPPAEGFNLAAWVMPFLVLVLGGFVVRVVVRNWSRNKQASPPKQVSQTVTEDGLRSRLEQELKERES